MNLANFIYKDGDHYYFDTENYTDEGKLKLSLDYEEGDRIIWKWDNKKHSGVLREAGANGTLFKLEKITLLE
jgi:hypothetical protein